MVPRNPAYFDFSRRRNRRKLIEDLRAQRLQAEYESIEREVKTSDVVEKAVEKGFPLEIADLLKMQLNPAGFMPQIPDEAAWRKNELDQLADRFAGSYIEQLPGGHVKLWDFTMIVARSTLMEYSSDLMKVSCDFPEGGGVELNGKVALAFIRYLYFIGLFEVENAKRPCPECGDKIPQNCETCGGLGWVID